LEQFPQLEVRLDTLLVPIDFSPGSRRALAHALPLARHFRARLVLVHVVKLHQECVDCGYGEVIREWPEEAVVRRAREHLRGMVRTLEKPQIRLETAVRSGEPASEIIAAAKDLGADLIVIGTRGLNPDVRDPMGSTAERVAREAGCPVLVVRQKEHDFVKIPATAALRRTRGSRTMAKR
jgi:universal stress protein A